MKVGYVRVSTGVQNLDLKIDALKTHGCEEILTDKISGAKEKRKGLEEALRYVCQRKLSKGAPLDFYQCDGKNTSMMMRVILIALITKLLL